MVKINLWTTMRWTRQRSYTKDNQAKIEKRYYTAKLHQDLWGNWILTRAWGDIESHRGRSVNIFCESYLAAKAHLDEVVKARCKKKYNLLQGKIKETPVTKNLFEIRENIHEMISEILKRNGATDNHASIVASRVAKPYAEALEAELANELITFKKDTFSQSSLTS
jgi:hypothetical protein